MPVKIECADKILKKLFVCEMKYVCFCRLIHCFMKSVISTRTKKNSLSFGRGNSFCLLPYRGLETSPSFACLAASKLGAAVRWTAALTRITSLWMARPRWAGHPPPFLLLKPKHRFLHTNPGAEMGFSISAPGVFYIMRSAAGHRYTAASGRRETRGRRYWRRAGS